MSDRAARNATCCEHRADDHDLWGCAVNVSTSSRAYERCHVLVPICVAESLWPGVVCQKPAHDDDRHEADRTRPAAPHRREVVESFIWSTASVEAEHDGRCPGCLRWVCACPCQCDDCARRKASR